MSTNQQVPHDPSLDNSAALLQEGYLFIPNRIDRYETDIFEAQLLGQKVICLRGKEAAQVFYNTEKFQRKGAAPKRVQQTLFGVNAIQTMDGQAHQHRKVLFMSLLNPSNQQQLGKLMQSQLHLASTQWEITDKVVLFDEMKKLLCKVACQWAGVPLNESEVTMRANDFISMIYAFGKVGPEHWKGRIARNRTENWIRGIITDVRYGNLEVEKGTALYEMAFHRQLNGAYLDHQMAAIELINVIRPIVANATYITFAALAMQTNPEEMKKLKCESNDYVEMFIHEVRRYYPFGPFIGARVRNNFTWNNYTFKKGTLVLLDVYGTNRDARLWNQPNEFKPSRFSEWDGNLFDFIPHGGGDPSKSHRCPGEGVTIEVVKSTINFLVHDIAFDVPDQDLSYSLSEMPTLPKSGFTITNVQRLN